MTCVSGSMILLRPQSSPRLLQRHSKWVFPMTRQTKYPLTNDTRLQSALSQRRYVMNPRCLLSNTSSWVNLPTSPSSAPSAVNENLCACYFIILYFFHPHEAAPMQEIYFHQRQYPLAVIISELETGSLTYACHVRNLQAPFVDASRRCAAHVRMVSPSQRTPPPHFHKRQSSGALCFS